MTAVFASRILSSRGRLLAKPRLSENLPTKKAEFVGTFESILKSANNAASAPLFSVNIFNIFTFLLAGKPIFVFLPTFLTCPSPHADSISLLEPYPYFRTVKEPKNVNPRLGYSAVLQAAPIYEQNSLRHGMPTPLRRPGPQPTAPHSPRPLAAAEAAAKKSLQFQR